MTDWLLHAQDSSGGFPHIIPVNLSFSAPNGYYPILKMRKLMIRGIKKFAQGSMAY